MAHLLTLLRGEAPALERSALLALSFPAKKHVFCLLSADNAAFSPFVWTCSPSIDPIRREESGFDRIEERGDEPGQRLLRPGHQGEPQVGESGPPGGQSQQGPVDEGGFSAPAPWALLRRQESGALSMHLGIWGWADSQGGGSLHIEGR